MFKQLLYAFLAFFAAKSGFAREESEDASPTESKLQMPEQLRLGPVDFQPRLVTGVLYDDNILLSSQNPESDVIWSVQPAFLAVAGDRLAIGEYRKTYTPVLGFNPGTFIVADSALWPGMTVSLDYGPRFNWFTKHSENDSIDEIESLNFLWPMSKLILGLKQDYRLENTTVIEANQRSIVQTINADLMSGYQFGEKTSAELNLRWHSIGYEVPTLNGYSDWSNDDWFNYQLDALLNLGAGLNVGLFDVENQGKQTYQQILGRARYTFSERLGFLAAAGLAFRQFPGGVSPTVEPVFNLTGNYHPRDGTTINLTGYSREQPSVYYGANYIVTGIGVGLRQQLWERFTLDMGLDYFVIDYRAALQNTLANRIDNYFMGRIGFEIRFSHHWVGNINYRFNSETSNQYNGFTDNQVGVQLTWSF